MTVAAVNPGPPGPLSEFQQQEVAAAHNRAKKIRKAAAVAGFNGWATGILAVCSLPFAFSSLSSFLVAVGLSVVAYNEFRGRQRLLQFDKSAPALLGWNQIGLLALIVIYCVWMLAAGLASDGPFTAELQANPELGEALGSVEGLDEAYQLILVAVYVGIIALSIVFQGLNAFYYFSRSKHLTAYLQDTADWVLNLQRLTSPTS